MNAESAKQCLTDIGCNATVYTDGSIRFTFRNDIEI